MGSPMTFPKEKAASKAIALQFGFAHEFEGNLRPVVDLREHFRFLDDIYLVCRPNCVVLQQCPPGVGEAHQHQHPLWKTKIWNRSGEKPSGVDPAAARVQDPRAIVWRGDQPVSEQGMKLLGVPLGQDEYAAKFLEKKTEFQLCLPGFRWSQMSKPVGCCHFVPVGCSIACPQVTQFV